MENNIPTPIPTPKLPDNVPDTGFKKSRIIVFLSYFYIAISILPMLLSLSFRGTFSLILIVIPFIIIFTKNKKVYNIAKILLILEFILSLIVPLFIVAFITSFR